MIAFDGRENVRRVGQRELYGSIVKVHSNEVARAFAAYDVRAGALPRHPRRLYKADTSASDTRDLRLLPRLLTYRVPGWILNSRAGTRLTI